jgi:hypothetical protein
MMMFILQIESAYVNDTPLYYGYRRLKLELNQSAPNTSHHELTLSISRDIQRTLLSNVTADRTKFNHQGLNVTKHVPHHNNTHRDAISASHDQQQPERDAYMNLITVAEYKHQIHPRIEDSKRPLHVLLLSYQRSGSSIISSLFGDNPHVFFLYEPLDSIYTALYGLAPGWSVPADLTVSRDGTLRYVHSFGWLAPGWYTQVCTLPNSLMDDCSVCIKIAGEYINIAQKFFICD